MNRLRKIAKSYELDGEKVPGVTTISGKLDKSNALKIWAARESASYAVENWDTLGGLPVLERARRIEGAHRQALRTKATRGTRIHALGDRLSRGADVEVPDELRGPVEAYAKFLDDWDMETLATESPAANTTYRYAGTLDAIVRCPRLGTVLLDVKTGDRVYADVSLQLAGYRFCDLRQYTVESTGPRGGKRTEVRETSMIETEAAYVAHVLGDSVELIPAEADEGIWAYFLYLREIYDFAYRIDWKGENRSTLDEPIFPEMRPVRAELAS